MFLGVCFELWIILDLLIVDSPATPAEKKTNIKKLVKASSKVNISASISVADNSSQKNTVDNSTQQGRQAKLDKLRQTYWAVLVLWIQMDGVVALCYQAELRT